MYGVKRNYETYNTIPDDQFLSANWASPYHMVSKLKRVREVRDLKWRLNFGDSQFSARE